MYCNNCGTQLPDNSKFCTKCGAALTTNVSPLPKKVNLLDDEDSYSVVQDDIRGERNRARIMQYIRGLPLVFCFLAFALETFSGTVQLRGSNVYDIFQEFLRHLTINNIPSTQAEFCRILVLLIAALFSCSILAAALSFISGGYGVLFGLLALIDYSYLSYFIISNSVSEIVPRIGFYIFYLLNLSGIVMCLISPNNEKKVSSGLIATAAILVSVGIMFYVIMHIYTY